MQLQKNVIFIHEITVLILSSLLDSIFSISVSQEKSIHNFSLLLHIRSLINTINNV